jgi:hypothetical protein
MPIERKVKLFPRKYNCCFLPVVSIKTRRGPTKRVADRLYDTEFEALEREDEAELGVVGAADLVHCYCSSEG